MGTQHRRPAPERRRSRSMARAAAARPRRFDDKQLPAVISRNVAALLDPGGAVQGPKGLTLEGGQKSGISATRSTCPRRCSPRSARARGPAVPRPRSGGQDRGQGDALAQAGRLVHCRSGEPPSRHEPRRQGRDEPGLPRLARGLRRPAAHGRRRRQGDRIDGRGQDPRAARRARELDLHLPRSNDFKTRMAALDDRPSSPCPEDGLTASDAGTQAVRTGLRAGLRGTQPHHPARREDRVLVPRSSRPPEDGPPLAVRIPAVRRPRAALRLQIRPVRRRVRRGVRAGADDGPAEPQLRERDVPLPEPGDAGHPRPSGGEPASRRRSACPPTSGENSPRETGPGHGVPRYESTMSLEDAVAQLFAALAEPGDAAPGPGPLARRRARPRACPSSPRRK